MPTYEEKVARIKELLISGCTECEDNDFRVYSTIRVSQDVRLDSNNEEVEWDSVDPDDDPGEDWLLVCNDCGYEEDLEGKEVIEDGANH